MSEWYIYAFLNYTLHIVDRVYRGYCMRTCRIPLKCIFCIHVGRCRKFFSLSLLFNLFLNIKQKLQQVDSDILKKAHFLCTYLVWLFESGQWKTTVIGILNKYSHGCICKTFASQQHGSRSGQTMWHIGYMSCSIAWGYRRHLKLLSREAVW